MKLFTCRPEGIIVVVTWALMLSSCAMKPEPFTPEQLTQLASEEMAAMFDSGEPLKGPLTEAETIARVLKYNLDKRAKMMEEALALNQVDIDRWDMLPRLAADAGFTSRSEYNATSSQDLYDLGGSLDEPSYSSDRDIFTTELGLSWNILDFGVSYFNAKQNADRVLIAAERKRRAVHNLIQEARFVFWRAAAHQALKDDVTNAISSAREALDRAHTIEKENLKAPAENLRFQKNLLETLRLLGIIRQELSTAEIELAALINLPPGTPIPIAIPENMSVPSWNVSLARMEDLAFMNNPDLREQEYQARIGANETRKSIARLFPGITLSGGYNYDSNSFLEDNNWYEAGLRLSWNLFKILAAPDVLEHAKTQESLTHTKKLALRMAVLAQVHVAERQFRNSVDLFQQADQIWQVDKKLYELSTARSVNAAEGTLERVAAQAAAIISKLRRFQMYAKVEQALGRLQVSIGHDLLPESVPGHDLTTLSEVIKNRLDEWDRVGEDVVVLTSAGQDSDSKELPR